MIPEWCVSLAITILIDSCLGGVLVSNKLFNLLTVHMFHHIISLPFLEGKTKTLIYSNPQVSMEFRSGKDRDPGTSRNGQTKRNQTNKEIDNTYVNNPYHSPDPYDT